MLGGAAIELRRLDQRVHNSRIVNPAYPGGGKDNSVRQQRFCERCSGRDDCSL